MLISQRSGHHETRSKKQRRPLGTGEGEEQSSPRRRPLGAGEGEEQSSRRRRPLGIGEGEEQSSRRCQEEAALLTPQFQPSETPEPLPSSTVRESICIVLSD